MLQSIAKTATLSRQLAEQHARKVASRLHYRSAVDTHTSPVGWKVIGAAIEIHRTLGPGLLESAYDNALTREFTSRGLRFARQVPVRIEYKGEVVGQPYRVDFVVEEELVVELKAVSQPAAIHRAQLRTYLRALGLRQGLLLNFNYPRLVDGMISVLLPLREGDR